MKLGSRINECFYEKVIKVKADVAAVLHFLRTNQVLLETLVDAIHHCRASIRTLSGPLLGPVHFRVRSKPRSITTVTDLGLLGLPSMARS
jgi:hypothetical protein